ncbi:hypothetical protein J437_LFUL018588 [Ladona fulva]|uniref:Uncharacterized protein n=1 Tax=Ladona fulva TaxID=123851 RepID=A0A8K0P7E0_LADFU|nr:hypothetical protein J437_LFUL018588 [Ladona fulva]
MMPRILIEDNIFFDDEELFLKNEHGEAELDSEEESECSSPSSLQGTSDSYESSPKSPKYSRVPLDMNIKVVNLAREHPKRLLATLQRLGSIQLKRKTQLKMNCSAVFVNAVDKDLLGVRGAIHSCVSAASTIATFHP